MVAKRNPARDWSINFSQCDHFFPHLSYLNIVTRNETWSVQVAKREKLVSTYQIKIVVSLSVMILEIRLAMSKTGEVRSIAVKYLIF